MIKYRIKLLGLLAIVCALCFIFAFMQYNTHKTYASFANITEDNSELPLDSLVDNGGLSSIFNRVACVGDSLSSGALEEHSAVGVLWHDEYQYSWGQYMARTVGNTVYNFSKGGMTAKIYCESFAEEKGFWDADKKCDAYYIALGVNDFFTYPGSIEMGSTADIDLDDWHNNKTTFAGYIGQIVQRLKEVNPDAVFFFITMPDDGGSVERAQIREQHAALFYSLADFFDNSFVIDLGKYAPKYDEEFKSYYFVGGHMNALGYYISSKLIMSYTDYIIRHNTQLFRDLGFDIPEDYQHVCSPVKYKIDEENLIWQQLTIDPNNNYWCLDDEIIYCAPQWNVYNPGDKSAVSIVFTAPADGTIVRENGSIGSCYRTSESGTDGVRLTVFLNDKKIYPESDSLWQQVNNLESMNITVSENLSLKQGDKLYYILDNGGNGANDYDTTYLAVGFRWQEGDAAPVWVDSSTNSMGWTDAESGNETFAGLSHKRKDVLSYRAISVEKILLPELYSDTEKPLENQLYDEGFATVFRKIGLMGDGCIKGVEDKLKNILKNEICDFQKDGATSEEYYQSIVNDLISIEKCTAYIIAFNENDFDGEYIEQIVAKLQERFPYSYIFLMALPKKITDTEPQTDLKQTCSEKITEVAEEKKYVYAIDLFTYSQAYEMQEEANYDIMANQVASYTDYIIRQNEYDFRIAGIPYGNPPKYIEEDDKYELSLGDLTYGKLPIDSENNYWCGAPDDELVYFAPQWIDSNPGTKYAIALAFTAPADGCIYPDTTTGIGSVYLKYAGGDGVRFAIFYNNTKIYPQGDNEWVNVPVGSQNVLYIKSDAFKMRKNDKLYYVLDNGGNGNNAYDVTYLVMGFNWTDDTHPTMTWFDSSIGSGGWTDTESGNESSSLGYPKNELISYKYLSFGNAGEDPVTPDNPSGGEDPVTPDNPSGGEDPVTPDNPSGGDDPVTPDNPSGGDDPVTPDNPSGGDEPVTPDNPNKGCGGCSSSVGNGGLCVIVLFVLIGILLLKRKFVR